MEFKKLIVSSREFERIQGYEKISCGTQLPFIGSITRMVRYAAIELDRDMQKKFITELDILINIFHSCKRAIISVHSEINDHKFEKETFIRNNASFYKSFRDLGENGYTILFGNDAWYLKSGRRISIKLKECEIAIFSRILKESSRRFVVTM